MHNPLELIAEIEELIVLADTAPTPEKRAEHLSSALAHGCRYIRAVKKKLPRVIDQVLERYMFSSESVSLPLRDIAASEPDLEVLRDKEILSDFLISSRDLFLRIQGFSEEHFNSLLKHIDVSYDAFMQLSLDKEVLMANFLLLEAYFCSPPWGGPGGPVVGPSPLNDGPAGATKSRSEQVCLYLSTFNSCATLLLEVIEKILKVPSSHTTQQERLPSLIELLSILATDGLGRHLVAAGEIEGSAEAYSVVRKTAVHDEVRMA